MKIYFCCGPFPPVMQHVNGSPGRIGIGIGKYAPTQYKDGPSMCVDFYHEDTAVVRSSDLYNRNPQDGPQMFT